MPHIHTAPGQHDHTISIYIIRTDFRQPKILLHMHRKTNLYAQFGGHIELDEHPWQTAARELEEETGYTLDSLQLLQPAERLQKMTRAIIHPQPVAHATMQYPGTERHSHTDVVYAFIATDEPESQPHDGESTDLRLFTRKELISLKQTDTITRETSLYIFDSILSSWKPISPDNFQL